MNCKHIEIKGNTTKYYYCKVKEKPIEEKDCKNCMLKIANIPKELEEKCKNIYLEELKQEQEKEKKITKT